MKNGLARIPRGVWVLGLVSMFMDMSSEMSHAILPLFLVGTLGASISAVGLIDGLAESFAMVVKVFSGVLSDRAGSRKWLAVLGYGLAAVSKPLFPLAQSPLHVLTARLADRLGKGIRGSPRDAMVADITPAESRGAAYGLRQALDTIGAVVGPLLAVVLIWHWAADLRTILWWACLPALLAVATLVFGVREPERKSPPGKANDWRSVFLFANPGRAFWKVLALGAVLTFARVSEAFLVLKASDVHLVLQFVPLVMVAMSLAYVFSVYPVGVLGDLWGTRGLLLTGMGVLVLADIVLARATEPFMVFGGAALWGLHMGLTQGLLSKLVADAAPADLRGTCFGYFNLALGAATLVSNVIAGALWDRGGAAWTFYWSAGFALITALVLMITWRSSAPQASSSHQ